MCVYIHIYIYMNKSYLFSLLHRLSSLPQGACHLQQWPPPDPTLSEKPRLAENRYTWQSSGKTPNTSSASSCIRWAEGKKDFRLIKQLTVQGLYLLYICYVCIHSWESLFSFQILNQQKFQSCTSVLISTGKMSAQTDCVSLSNLDSNLDIWSFCSSVSMFRLLGVMCFSQGGPSCCSPRDASRHLPDWSGLRKGQKGSGYDWMNMTFYWVVLWNYVLMELDFWRWDNIKCFKSLKFIPDSG